MLHVIIDFIAWMLGKPKRYLDLGEGIRMSENNEKDKLKNINKQIKQEKARFSPKPSHSAPAKVVKGSNKSDDNVRKWEMIRKRTKGILKRTKKGEPYNVLYMPSRWVRRRKPKNES